MLTECVAADNHLQRKVLSDFTAPRRSPPGNLVAGRLTLPPAPKPPDRGRCHPDYAAMVEHADQSVGRILAVLDELDLAENTMVVFFSANGGPGRYTSKRPCAARSSSSTRAASACQ